MKGCICPRSRRRWLPDSTCATCGRNVLEEQLVPTLLEILCGGTGLVLWRNNAGMDSHWPSGEKRKAPIRYGVGAPGGADYIGLYNGKFVAVEFKTARGEQSADQRAFETVVVGNRGVYAVIRCAADATELLSALRA